MGLYRQEHWNRLPCPLPGDLPNPGIEPASLTYPALGRWVLYHYHHLGSPSKRGWGPAKKPADRAWLSRSSEGHLGMKARTMAKMNVTTAGNSFHTRVTERAPWSWLGFFVCLFSCCFGRITQHAGSYFPDEGLNPHSLPWKCRVNHWTAEEVPWLCFT